MQKINSNQLKRDCFIALLIPVALLSLVQIGARKDWSAWWMIAIAIMGAFVIGRTLYQFFNRLEDLTWQEQLASLVKRVTTPVMIADINHEITFSNDSFNRLPLSTLLLKHPRLPELLASQSSALDLTERFKKIAHYSEVLENLSAKLKTRFALGEHSYEWTLLPLFSPTGQRWGTLIECAAMKDVDRGDHRESDCLPLPDMLEQLAAPFMFVSADKKVSYANLSLKMLLIRHQGIIAQLCPSWDIYEPTGDSLDNFMILAQQEHTPFDDLVKLGQVTVNLRDEKYQLSFQTLTNFHNDEMGTIVLWQDLSLSSQEPQIISQAVSQAIHPLVILDEHAKIKEINPAMVRILEKGKSNTLLSDALNSKNFIDVVDKFSPAIFMSFCNALKSNKTTIFIAEHYEQYCDWIINPIRERQKTVGYIVEIVYPSKQMHQGYEECLARMQNRRQAIEKELKQFTNGIAKLNLYQKEPHLALGQFSVEDYRHPLLRNSVKIITQLANSLGKIHEELDKLRNKIQSGSIVEKSSIITTPLHEVNILSSSIARNVQEIRYDFTAIDQELNTLKNLIKEHKSLNQAYVKPIQKAIQATEQALLQTLGYSETVTLVVHQLHEIHGYLSKLQTEILSHLSPKVAQEVSTLLDSVKSDLLGCKEKLCEMISEYDRLRDSWRQASESLTSCLHLSENVEQASERWNASSGSACEYSIEVERHLQHLFSLTEKLQMKTASMEQLQSTATYASESSQRQFDHVVIEIDEGKKKAEDVLLEGIKKA